MRRPTPWTIIVVGHRYRQRHFSTRVIELVAGGLALLADSVLARPRLPSLAQLGQFPIMVLEQVLRRSCLLPILWYLPSFLVERRAPGLDYSIVALLLQVQEWLVKRASTAAVLAPSFLHSVPWPRS